MQQAPEIGTWYRRADRDLLFQVVGVDPRAGTVEIEAFDGTIDEWPLAHWHALPIQPADAPQDWSGPFDAGGRADDEREPGAPSLDTLPDAEPFDDERRGTGD